MSYVVYADVMLVWIFIINYLTYYITCKIINHRISRGKLIIWSLISAILLELIYIGFLYSNILLLKILYIIINFSMFVLFFKIILKTGYTLNILRAIGYNLFGTVMLAGIFMIFYSELTSLNTLTPVIATISIIIPLILKLYPAKKQQNIYQVDIRLNNKTIRTYGYYDTGNTLLDIYSKKPVIILDYRLIYQIIPDKDKYSLEKYIHTGNYEDIAHLIIDNELLHPICYKTISSEFSIMPGLNIKCLIINKKYIYKNIIGAISQNIISNTKDYMVLLNNNL